MPTLTLSACWRYPVKSFQGQPAASVSIDAAGVVGDRAWGVVDRRTGGLLSAKETRQLLEASIEGDTVVLPDGTSAPLGSPDADRGLSRWLGREVTLAQPVAGQQLHYRMTFDPPDDSAELVEIPAPAGSFRDLAPLHLVCAATLEHCGRQRPDLDWDVRRFRPNLVLAGTGEAFIEDSWAGRTLRIGSALVEVLGPTVRCAMPLRAQPGGLDRQPDLFRALQALNPAHPNHLGVYATVVEPGTVTVGDDGELLA